MKKKNILVIKLASAGDVLRTTALLSGLKDKYPDSRITWVVEPQSRGLLEGNLNIDNIFVYGEDSVSLLKTEEFDIVISLDKAFEAISLAMLVRAPEKYGYGMDREGRLCPLNREAEYSYLLGIDDNLKFFKNNKTYQELIFESSRLQYKGNQYELILGKRHLDFAADFFKNNNLGEKDAVIGINTGSGRAFANKNLRRERIVELIKLLRAELAVKIILLGGPLEEEINRYIKKCMGHEVIDAGCGNTLKDFAALINRCSLVIASDTLAMHMAIALKKPVIALFGPTCSQEIDLYGAGCKIISGAKCGPCYKKKCYNDITCMDMIGLDKILEAAKGLMEPCAKI